MEEQASAVEAVRAENAAALAKLAENEARAAAVRDAVRDLRAAHDAQARVVRRCSDSAQQVCRRSVFGCRSPRDARFCCQPAGLVSLRAADDQRSCWHLHSHALSGHLGLGVKRPVPEPR